MKTTINLRNKQEFPSCIVNPDNVVFFPGTGDTVFRLENGIVSTQTNLSWFNFVRKNPPSPTGEAGLKHLYEGDSLLLTF